jgi:hypothetical protein
MNFSQKKQKMPITKNKIKLRSNNKVRMITWSFIVLCFMALFFTISLFFTSVSIIIKPKIESVAFNNESFIISLKNTSTQIFPFETLNIVKMTYKNVESAGEKEVEIKAHGEVTIYNTYSTAEQRLIAGTRFSRENGDIYRLDNAITIPGMKKINGQNIPGSINGEISADIAGSKYNILTTDSKEKLKIVSFKNTPKYNDFYATLDEDITGGFSGKKNTITSEEEDELLGELQSELKEEILTDLKVQIKDTYLSLADLNYIKYGPLLEENDGDKVKVGLKATLNAIVLNKSKTASYLASQKITGFNNLPVSIRPQADFKITPLSSSTRPWLEKELEISITGQADIVWKYDAEEVKTKLVGKKRTEISAIKDKYQESISDIKVNFRPFWQIFLPDDPARITVAE